MDPFDFIPSQDFSFWEVEHHGEEEEEEEEKEKEEEEEELLLRPRARPLLSPPAHGYPDEGGVPRPDFVLIEQMAYFIDRDNATTASCDMTAPLIKGRIKVTFCTAPPPLVSYYCVHTTAYDHTDFIADPLILASETDGGLVLLRLIIGTSQSDFFRPVCRHLFIYDSGNGRRRPSLKQLPHPGATLEFNGPSLAIVRQCNNRKKEEEDLRSPARNQDENSDYSGPTLRPRHKLRPPRSVSSSASSGYALHPHSASSGFALHPHSASSGSALHPHSASSGSTLHPHSASRGSAFHPHECNNCDYVIVARASDYGYTSPSFLLMYHSKTDLWSSKAVQAPKGYSGHITSKTITIGEEVAWVDLSRDIIFCDVLAETPKCRVVRLPLPIEKLPDPSSVRDIAILDGCINYVKLRHQINKDDTVDGWSATKWSKKITNPSDEWYLDHKVHSSSISGSPKLEGKGHMAQPDLRKLFLGLPNLSLQDNGIVYYLAKIHYWDSEQTAWVVAVDLKNNKVHEVVEYNALRTVGLSIGYKASRISKYLKGAPVIQEEGSRC
uniref:Uncharacterized protein n=1 Tax=Avena sativa TaxID=4498 RepID=A0ACD5XMV9_AVESA